MAFALVSANDSGHVRRFLEDLKAWGLVPGVVVTDGSNLYPEVLAEVWPDAHHQLGILHVLKELHEHALDAVRRLRRGLSRRGNRGRKRKPGRRPRSRPKRRGLTNEEKSAFVFKHRLLVMRRRDRMSEQEEADLTTTPNYLSELKTLREFVDRPGLLFEQGQSESTARRRHAALVSDRPTLAVPELAKAIGALGSEKFARMIAFLGGPACRRVRTNNHVERFNRKLRHEERAKIQVAEASDDGAVPGAAAGSVSGTGASHPQPPAR